jgi:KUP system potassium uptake protein
VTGAEALYADMGHFGKKPVWLAWFGLAFPALLLNYAGQSAMILSGADISQNVFFRLCPPFLQIPLVILATLATIIASQAIITGAFSMTRQAINSAGSRVYVLSKRQRKVTGKSISARLTGC